MRLYVADYHLEAGRVCLAEGERTDDRGQTTDDGECKRTKLEEARGHLEKAEALVNKTGYHRRDGELEEIRRAVER